MAIVLRGLDAVLLYALLLPPLTGRTGPYAFKEGLRKAAGLTHLSSFVLVGVHECLVPIPLLIPLVFSLFFGVFNRVQNKNVRTRFIGIPIGS